jgi:hypothetical protein
MAMKTRTRIVLTLILVGIAFITRHAGAQTLDETVYFPIAIGPGRVLYNNAFSDTDMSCGPWVADPASHELYPWCYDMQVYARDPGIFPPFSQRMRYSLAAPYTSTLGIRIRAQIQRNYTWDALKPVRVGLKYVGPETAPLQWEWCTLREPSNVCFFDVDRPVATFDEIWLVFDDLVYDSPDRNDIAHISWLLMTEEVR